MTASRVLSSRNTKRAKWTVCRVFSAVTIGFVSGGCDCTCSRTWLSCWNASSEAIGMTSVSGRCTGDWRIDSEGISNVAIRGSCPARALPDDRRSAAGRRLAGGRRRPLFAGRRVLRAALRERGRLRGQDGRRRLPRRRAGRRLGRAVPHAGDGARALPALRPRARLPVDRDPGGGARPAAPGGHDRARSERREPEPGRQLARQPVRRRVRAHAERRPRARRRRRRRVGAARARRDGRADAFHVRAGGRLPGVPRGRDRRDRRAVARALPVRRGLRAARRAHAHDGLRVPRRPGALRPALAPVRRAVRAARLPRPLPQRRRRRRQNTISYGNPAGTHDPVGWPTFKDWPHHESLTHEQTYYKWVERSWRGGLRLFVNLLVDNEVLCTAYPLKKNSCNEMDGVRLQARRMRELEAYIDAQNGGPGKGWFRIVTNPFEARRVMNEGKLAVVLGIEVSKLFDCGVFLEQPECDAAKIDRNLDEVYDLGVRDMELVNKFDNALAGVAGDNGTTGVIVNNGNKAETGSYWDMETCKGPPDESDREQPTPFGHNHDDLIGNGLAAFTQSGVTPVYGPAPHCNRRGLSPLGDFAVNKMIDKRMVIDPDHLSVLARKQLLPI